MTQRDVLWDDDGIDLLREGVRRRLRPGERVDDVIEFLTSVAELRARVRERPLDGFEVGLVAAAFCWWPLRPRPPESYRRFAYETRADLLLQAVDGVRFSQESVPAFIVEADPETLMQIIGGGQPPTPFFM
jgi:hypothetical protein